MAATTDSPFKFPWCFIFFCLCRIGSSVLEVELFTGQLLSPIFLSRVLIILLMSISKVQQLCHSSYVICTELTILSTLEINFQLLVLICQYISFKTCYLLLKAIYFSIMISAHHIHWYHHVKQLDVIFFWSDFLKYFFQGAQCFI